MKNGLLDRLDRLFLVVTNNCNARCSLPVLSSMNRHVYFPVFICPISYPVVRMKTLSMVIILRRPGRKFSIIPGHERSIGPFVCSSRVEP
jgi:hypothetical protein